MNRYQIKKNLPRRIDYGFLNQDHLFYTLCKIWNDGKKCFDAYYELKKRELDELYHEKSSVSKYEGEKSIILHLLLKPEVRGFFSTYKQISSFGYIDIRDLAESNLKALKPKIIKVSEKLKAKKQII